MKIMGKKNKNHDKIKILNQRFKDTILFTFLTIVSYIGGVVTHHEIFKTALVAFLAASIANFLILMFNLAKKTG